MVDRIKNIFIVLIALSLFSCAYIGVPKHIKRGFTFCYSEEETNIKELINIEGYFEMNTPNSSSLAFMFYEDGTFLYGFFDVDEDRRKKGDSNISLYFREIINDNKGQISTVFYKSFQWGYYQIKGDTIKAQYVNHPASPSPTWSAWEVWYKIIDRNTIVEIYHNPIHYMSESDWENWEKNKKQREKTIVPAKFIPVDEKPAPNCWLKKEDWFWCQ
jgi:hypothetical protein